MAKARIAILEDDNVIAAAMTAAFERSGYEVFWTNQTTEMNEYLGKFTVATLFVDCLLPGGSGVDFVTSIRKKFPANVLDVVIMSGIFTDAGFIKETTRATRAISFLKKPFELQEAMDCVKVKETAPRQEVESSPRKALYLLFNKPKVSVREKRKVIEALEEIHGFDLPYLYSLMVETLATGHLNIVNGKGEVSGISFSQGKIVAVDITDQETQLGTLLLESGYIHPDDLKEGLNITSSKRLGEKLISNNLLSPHAFNIALANQMSIRLSRTIVDAALKVNFVTTDVELTHPHIDSDALSIFLHDWIASKISVKWLKAHYMQWGDYSLAKSSTFQPTHPVLMTPLVAHFSGFVDYFTKGQSLHQLMDTKKFPEDTAYKALHLLLAKGLLIFGDRTAVMDPVERLKHLKKLQSQLQGKNNLEAWDLMARIAGVSDTEPQLVVGEFKKLLGPEPGPAEAQCKEIYAQLSKLGQDVFNFSQTGSREKMKEEIAKAEVQAKMKANSQLEEAKNCLQKSQFAQAATLLQKAEALDPSLPMIRLYLIWSRLGQLDSSRMNAGLLNEVEMELMQIPPEEKFEALYAFVMGLYQRARGDGVAAKKSFEKAYNIDNTLLVARREMSLINSQQAKKKDVLNRDLKDLVAGFFKKK